MESRPRALALLLDIVSVGLLAAAVWLFWDARSGASQAPSGRDGAAAVGTRIAVGSHISPFFVEDGEGATLAGVEPGQAGHLLFVFRSDCPACAAQKAEWRALARFASVHGVRVAAYTPEALGVAVSGYFGDVPLAVMRFADPAGGAAALDIRVVPTTFVVDAEGRVLLHHQGVLPPAASDSIRRLAEGLGRARSRHFPVAGAATLPHSSRSHDLP